MLGKFEVPEHDSMAPVVTVADEHRLSRAYRLDSGEPPEGYVHYETALAFEKTLRDVDDSKHSHTLKAWGYLAQRAHESETFLYGVPVSNIGFMSDFVIDSARAIEVLLNGGLVKKSGLSSQSASFLVHLANVQLSAEPPLPELACYPLEVNRALPK